MKSLKMGKVLGNMRRKNTTSPAATGDGVGTNGLSTNGESPEAIAARSVKAFCESSGPNNSGDEVLYLPPIVDAAESSPSAAAECARLIRKYLKKENWSSPSYQYNAIMIMRILADNPGETFTRNMDQKFADTVKELVRGGRDPSVRQILMETLDTFEHTKAYDQGLTTLIDMWRREKDKAKNKYGGRGQQQQQMPLQQPPLPGQQIMNAPPFDPHSQNYFARSHSNPRLPSPAELASRLEEASTSANLLHQVVSNTPPAEILGNELIKEFANRCTSASRSIQLYMTATDPSPDNDTMEHLINTNEQLQAALSLHQRAVLNAKKQTEHVDVAAPHEATPPALVLPTHHASSGSSRRPSPNPAADDGTDYDPPPIPPRKSNGKGKEREYDNAVAGPSRGHTPAPEEDPFRDPKPDDSGFGGGAYGAGGALSTTQQEGDTPRLGAEPYHPGFSSTPSYVQRQESSLGKETMHGAFNTVADTKSTPRNHEHDDDDDIYDAPPKNKGPMYRY